MLQSPGRAAHAARLRGRVPRQHRQPQGDGRLAGARGLLRPARAAAAEAARLPHARRCALARDNLQPSILASCSIPFWLEPCTTSPARRAAPTGTAASPTTTCTWTTRRWPTAWCCIRISRQTVIPGLARQGAASTATAPPRPGQRGAALAAPGMDRHPAERASCPTATTSRPMATTSPAASRPGAARVRKGQRLADEFADLVGTAARSRPCRWPQTTIQFQPTQQGRERQHGYDTANYGLRHRNLIGRAVTPNPFHCHDEARSRTALFVSGVARP